MGRVGAYQRFVNHKLACMPADIRFFTIGLVCFFFPSTPPNLMTGDSSPRTNHTGHPGAEMVQRQQTPSTTVLLRIETKPSKHLGIDSTSDAVWSYCRTTLNKKASLVVCIDRADMSQCTNSTERRV